VHIIRREDTRRKPPSGPNVDIMGGDPTLRGRESAEGTLRDNRITDPAVIAEVKAHALPFSDFQQRNLFHPTGFYENRVEFTSSSMPLLPQMMSPVLGRIVADTLYTYYLERTRDKPQDVAFLGLGAGRGILDYDMIEYITGGKFQNFTPEYTDNYERFRRGRFIVSDRTDKSMRLLHSSLDGLVRSRDLRDRVEIKQLDAVDFTLGKKHPFGIVYSNELLDALPIQPIIEVRGERYLVYVVPYAKNQTDEDSDYKRNLGKIFPRIKNRILTSDEFNQRADAGKLIGARFHPVLVPLNADPDFELEVNCSETLQAFISRPEFDGLYPFQLSLGKMMTSIKRSFEHGIVLFMDYSPSKGGHHNYNVTLNSPPRVGFGERDCDFQVDFMQVAEAGRDAGMSGIYYKNLEEHLREYGYHMEGLGSSEFRRWAELNDKSHPKPAEALLTYAMGAKAAKGYRIMVLGF